MNKEEINKEQIVAIASALLLVDVYQEPWGKVNFVSEKSEPEYINVNLDSLSE